MGRGAGCQRKRIVNSLRGARALFSFQLIILLEQFGLLERKEERFIYIKISPALLAKILACVCILWSYTAEEAWGVRGRLWGVLLPKPPREAAPQPHPPLPVHSLSTAP